MTCVVVGWSAVAQTPLLGCRWPRIEGSVLSYPGATLYLSGSTSGAAAEDRSDTGGSGEKREDEMRTYDPADHILYVHLAQDPAVPATFPRAHDECHRLPADYANVSLRARIGEAPTAAARPALVLLPGGSSAPETSAPAAPALRLLSTASGT